MNMGSSRIFSSTPSDEFFEVPSDLCTVEFNFLHFVERKV